jgi:hypothetical protein
MVCYARSITATVAPTTDASIAFASPRAKKSSRNVIIQSMTQTASTQPSAKLLAAIGCGRCERARTRSARGLRPGFQLARSTQRPACPAFPETHVEAGFRAGNTWKFDIWSHVLYSAVLPNRARSGCPFRFYANTTKRGNRTNTTFERERPKASDARLRVGMRGQHGHTASHREQA